MTKTNKIGITVIKTDTGEIIVKNQKKMDKLLDNLSPGIYTFWYEKKSQKLESMKKHYFSMETHLANHLGMYKPDLHKELMKVFTKFDEHDGEVYESIADIKTEEDMMQRIIHFQVYAAEHFKYTMEPYRDTE